jgi:hypothetical protein
MNSIVRLVVPLFFLGGISGPLSAHPSEQLPTEQRQFWERLQSLCGKTFAGQISDVTDHYREGLAEARLAMHVRECSDDRIHIPLEVNDNRSRNWILTIADSTIRLKHDHRNPDGTEEEISQYGGDALAPGLAHRQIFPADSHTASILPDRADNFWFLDFVDDQTLHYGVHWPKHGHSVRIEFDLSQPIESLQPPWGYD